MGKFDRFCQSCGMPMDQDPGKGGTLANGEKTQKFCSLCFEQGKFKDEFTTASEMVSFVKDKLREMGHGPIKRWFYTSHISRLERWNG